MKNEQNTNTVMENLPPTFKLKFKKPETRQVIPSEDETFVLPVYGAYVRLHQETGIFYDMQLKNPLGRIVDDDIIWC